MRSFVAKTPLARAAVAVIHPVGGRSCILRVRVGRAVVLLASQAGRAARAGGGLARVAPAPRPAPARLVPAEGERLGERGRVGRCWNGGGGGGWTASRNLLLLNCVRAGLHPLAGPHAGVLAVLGPRPLVFFLRLHLWTVH